MSKVQQHFIEASESGTQIALLEDGAVLELHSESLENRSLVGNIYRGKVRRVLPDMQAAFIDIGLERPGFLHRRDMLERPQDITKVLHEGQSVIVQVSRDPRGQDDKVKGATLTSNIRLVGTTLVWLPCESVKEVVLSKKLRASNVTELDALVDRLNNSMPSGTLIFRQGVADSDVDVEEEFAQIRQRWEHVKENHDRPPALILNEFSLPERAVREAPATELLWADDESKDRITGSSSLPESVWEHRSQILKEQESDTYRALVKSTRQEQSSRVIPLANGGEIILERTEAMWVIDVNTAAATANKDAHQQTNLLAAAEVARQLRLRDIGGIVIVDFIDVSPEQRQEFLTLLEQRLARDPARTTCGAKSDLGLIEITRQQRFLSASRDSDTCPHCDGSGMLQQEAG